MKEKQITKQRIGLRLLLLFVCFLIIFLASAAHRSYGAEETGTDAEAYAAATGESLAATTLTTDTSAETMAADTGESLTAATLTTDTSAETIAVAAGGSLAATALTGTAGTYSYENYTNLFDEDTTTKWCIQNFKSACVIWEMEEAVSVTGYTIVTGNDSATYTGRNPASWKLYACNASSVPDADYDGWVLIDEVSDSGMEDKNYREYNYEISESLPEYTYYKLVISETQGATTMQISEIALDYEGAPDYVCLIDDEDDLLSDELKETLMDVFLTVYPQMAAEYNQNAPKFVKVTIYSGSTTYTAYSQVYLSAPYLNSYPEDYDCFTHELMHVVQQYPSYDPSWLVEGIADYARYVYGLNNTAAGWAWKVPTASSSYTDSYRTTAGFLYWLETESGVGSGIVKELDARLRDLTYDTETHSDWEEITGKSLDTLWADYLESYGIIIERSEDADTDDTAEGSSETQNDSDTNTDAQDSNADTNTQDNSDSSTDTQDSDSQDSASGDTGSQSKADDTSAEKIADGLADSALDGVWYYYTDGEIDTSFTGLAKNKNGWFYVKNGKVDFSVTGLIKHTDGNWYYVKNGKIQFSYTGLIKHTDNNWYYVKNGYIRFSYTGLVKHTDGNTYYVKNGLIRFSYTGLVTDSNGTWYVKNGKVNTSFSGTVVYNNKNYTVKNGKVV